MILLRCILGLGANLFNNSPMEVCVVICRKDKPRKRRGKILLINAVNEVTRERSQSNLTWEHIQRIAGVYHKYKDEPGFSRAATKEEILTRDGNMSIPLYVSSAVTGDGNGTTCDSSELLDALSSWLESSSNVRRAL